MKVKNPASTQVRSFDRVESKSDRDSFSRQFQQEKKEERRKGEEVEVTDEKVVEAIEAFSEDAQAKAHGLTAKKLGEGPGLKVVLQDGSGAVVRQLTGEEFLKLRTSVSADEPTTGKLLDQKL